MLGLLQDFDWRSTQCCSPLMHQTDFYDRKYDITFDIVPLPPDFVSNSVMFLGVPLSVRPFLCLSGQMLFECVEWSEQF